jgi:hypothetical protein
MNIYKMTYSEECLQIRAEARDSPAGRQEREHCRTSVRTFVQVPSMSSDAEVGRYRCRLARRVVCGGNGTGIVVGQPDHDFVRC